MANQIINKYISERYDRWLDYARYHCSHAHMEDEAIDVLNEVLAMLIEKCESNEFHILKLYDSKKGKYRELDFFVLQMIKLNIQSPTSPYRHKYKPIPVDENVDFQRMDIIDEEDPEQDRSGDILQKMQKVRSIFDNLQLSKKAKRVFSWKFFEGNSFSEWEGPEDKKDLYDIYNGVQRLIDNEIHGVSLFPMGLFDNNNNEIMNKQIEKETPNQVLSIISEISGIDQQLLKENKSGEYPNAIQAIFFLVCEELGIEASLSAKLLGRSETTAHNSAMAMRSHLLDNGKEIEIYNQVWDKLDQI